MSTKYSKEFKLEAVKNAVKNHKSAAEVARELGANANTMRLWVKQYKEDKKEPFVGSGNLRAEAQHIRELERKVKDLEEENAILKKQQPSLRGTERIEVHIHRQTPLTIQDHRDG